MDVLEYIKKMQEMYGDDVITTADKINRPDPKPIVKEIEIFNEFNRRNPKADGGQLVTPSVDGSRPGYAGTGAAPLESKGISLTKDQLSLLKEKLTPQEFRKLKFGLPRKADAYDIGVFQRYKVTDPEVKSGVKKAGKKNRLFFKIQNILFPGKYELGGKILNNKKWTDTVIKLTKAGKSSDDITSVLMKSDKKINRNIVSSAINALVKQNKLDDKYTIMGGSGYTKAEMIEVDNIIKKEVAKGELGRADIGRKAEISDAYVERWIRENKGNKFYETNYSYEKGLLKKGNLQQQKNLFKLVESGADLSLKNVNEALNIKNGKIVMADLVSTIYRMTGNSKTNSLVVPYDNEPRMREVLNKIRNSPDFEDIYQRRMGNLIRDAYEGKPILKEKALKSFNEYTQFNRQLRLVAPEIANQLDHVVPYQFLDEVKQGGNPVNLIKVKPIPAAVNKFKSYFDAARINVARELRINPNNLDALAKFKLLKDLEKSMPIEFGGISDKGHVYDFKQKPIGKSDLIADAKDAVRLYNETGKFSQKVLKDKALQKKIIDAGVGTGKNLSIFKTIKPLSEKRTLQLTKLIEDLCPNKKASGGRIGYQSGTAVTGTLQCGINQFNKNMKTGNANSALMRRILANGGNILKSVGKQLNPAELLRLRNLIGPQALGFFAAFEAGDITDDILRKNIPVNEALAKNSLTKTFLPYREQGARAKNLLQSGKLTTDAQKKYALDLMKLDQAIIKQEQVEQMKLDQGLGYGGDESGITNEMIDAAEKDLERRVNAIGDPVSTEGSAIGQEYQTLEDEMIASRLDKFKLPFQSDKGTRLVNKLAKPPGRRVGPGTAKREMKIDFSLPTYDRMETPTNQDILNTYRQYGIISPTEFKTGVLQPGEGTLIRMMQGGQGLYGTQERFARGGLSGGDTSGRPPESGPMSQGLRSLYNNGRKL